MGIEIFRDTCYRCGIRLTHGQLYAHINNDHEEDPVPHQDPDELIPSRSIVTDAMLRAEEASLQASKDRINQNANPDETIYVVFSRRPEGSLVSARGAEWKQYDRYSRPVDVAATRYEANRWVQENRPNEGIYMLVKEDIGQSTVSAVIFEVAINKNWEMI